MGSLLCGLCKSVSPPLFSQIYELQEEIGRGTYGRVYKAVNRLTGDEFAVKKFNTRYFMRRAVGILDVECDMLRRLHHQNIVTLVAQLSEKEYFHMVFEKVNGREIFVEISNMAQYDERDAKSYFRQLVNAVAYCHRCDVLHDDINPSNILLQPLDNKIKLIGFRQARRLDGNKETYARLIKEPHYMAPEIVKRLGCNKPVDVWACGAILYNLLSGLHPFRHASKEEMKENIKRGPIPYQIPEFEGISLDGIQLMKKMLKRNRKNRFTAQQALTHPFVTDVNDPSTMNRQLTMKNIKEYVRTGAWGHFSNTSSIMGAGGPTASRFAAYRSTPSRAEQQQRGEAESSKMTDEAGGGAKGCTIVVTPPSPETSKTFAPYNTAKVDSDSGNTVGNVEEQALTSDSLEIAQGEATVVTNNEDTVEGSGKKLLTKEGSESAESGGEKGEANAAEAIAESLVKEPHSDGSQAIAEPASADAAGENADVNLTENQRGNESLQLTEISDQEKDGAGNQDDDVSDTHDVDSERSFGSIVESSRCDSGSEEGNQSDKINSSSIDDQDRPIEE